MPRPACAPEIRSAALPFHHCPALPRPRRRRDRHPAAQRRRAVRRSGHPACSAGRAGAGAAALPDPAEAPPPALGHRPQPRGRCRARGLRGPLGHLRADAHAALAEGPDRPGARPARPDLPRLVHRAMGQGRLERARQDPEGPVDGLPALVPQGSGPAGPQPHPPVRAARRGRIAAGRARHARGQRKPAGAARGSGDRRRGPAPSPSRHAGAASLPPGTAPALRAGARRRRATAPPPPAWISPVRAPGRRGNR